MRIRDWFDLGPLTVYTYGVLLAAAHLLGLEAGDGARRKAGPRRQPRPSTLASTSSSAQLIVREAAAPRHRLPRLVHGEPQRIADDRPLWRCFLWRPHPRGREWRCVYIRRIGLPLWTTCDVIAPGIALGHVVGRFGCLFAGCCFGRQVAEPHWWTVTFTDPFAATNVGTPLNVPLYPTQLSTRPAPSFLILLRAPRHGGARANRLPDGRSGSTCCSTPSPDSSSSSSAATIAGRSGCFLTSQFISLLLAPLAVVMLAYLSRAKTPEPKRAKKAA